ncbi:MULTISPECIES: hypothetical protein [unclassified Aureimonas]|uniref:hypothetical protein n=1 Tax=unclassified Aureimonas TaxID=2615206 RepID=UPI0006F6B92E|nr:MULTISPECIES: hypothetical protein [unclassified Aureimonas]KQT57483.1 hypothetical protein ASG62_09190 [Aureimonas sp. Leaf427]KQT77163.1 hypothetical protein ASG54_13060 [Aureimonas sp. Leaf460]
MSAARYTIFAHLRGYTDNAAFTKIVASGKLTATSSAMSEVITVPAAPKGCDLIVSLRGRYVDDVAKSGAGWSYVAIWEGTETPAFGTSNVAVEAVPRAVIDPPLVNNIPSHADIAVRPGQKFAILDTGWAL